MAQEPRDPRMRGLLRSDRPPSLQNAALRCRHCPQHEPSSTPVCEGVYGRNTVLKRERQAEVT